MCMHAQENKKEKASLGCVRARLRVNGDLYVSASNVNTHENTRVRVDVDSCLQSRVCVHV